MVESLTRRLNDLKLREKMLFAFVVFMVLPLLLVGLGILLDLRQKALDEALARAEAAVERLSRQTLETLEVGIRVSDRLVADRSFASLLTTEYRSTLEVFRAYHAFDTFRFYRDVSPELVGLSVYADNDSLIDNWEVRPLDPPTRRTFWYTAAVGHPGEYGWFSWKDPTKDPRTRLSLVRSLRFPEVGVQGVLVVDLDSSRIDTALGPAGYETLILDANQSVIASSHGDLVGRILDDYRLMSLVAQGDEGSYQREFRGTRWWVFLKDLKIDGAFNQLQIACIVSPQVITGPADQALGSGLLLLSAGALVALLFLWLVYSLFARRLETLSRQLPLVAAGNFHQVLPVDGHDEIGQLTAQFNTMVVDIRALMDKVRAGEEARHRLERAEGEMRFKMLASQIHPHFLFNVLESIRMKAHLQGEREIATTVKLLGKLMRRNLEAGSGPIPLREELENARYFLEIEKFRLEEKLEYALSLPPELAEVPVPPLIVEPLVENAVVHGLEGRRTGGRVEIRVEADGAFLVVEVSDNGQGFDPARVRALLEGTGVDGGSSHHVGLANIHQRLVLLHGPGSGLRVQTQPGAGTRVSFRIPRPGGDPCTEC